jgi:hypothetical protein
VRGDILFLKNEAKWEVVKRLWPIQAFDSRIIRRQAGGSVPGLEAIE